MEAASPLPVTSSTLESEAAKIADLERKALYETPEGKSKSSIVIERRPMGNAVKKASNHKCQVCEALGLPLASSPHLKPLGLPPEGFHVIETGLVQSVPLGRQAALDMAEAGDEFGIGEPRRGFGINLKMPGKIAN